MARHSNTVSMNCMDMTWLALDSINERIIFHAILAIDGEVNTARLNDALVTTVQRHPALRTVLLRKLLRHYREYRDSISPQMLEIRDGSSGVESEHRRYLTEWVNRPLDPKMELPFRVLLLKKGPAQYWLAFTFHHYATDALRALRFANEMIREYNKGDDPEAAVGKAALEDSITAHRVDELLPLIQRPKSKVKWYYPQDRFKPFPSICHLPLHTSLQDLS
jgi:NRPS condensation-like uncharacterized protein